MDNSYAFCLDKVSREVRTGFWLRKKRILHSIDFKLVKGLATGFVGVNGAGKSTLIKILLGLTSPSEGRIQWGEDENNVSLRDQIGFLPERPFLPLQLTAEQFLKFHWQLRYKSKKDHQSFTVLCDEILSRVGLRDVKKQRLKSFSKGMLQRIGFAQALIGRPQILILDEPMSGLDPDGRLLFKKILTEERDRGCTLFFSSHLLSDIEEVCNRVVVIDQGHLLFHGRVSELMKGHEQLEGAFAALRNQRLLEQGGR